MFDQDTTNNNSDKLVFILIEVDLVSCDGRSFLMVPEWTHINFGLTQKSVFNYLVNNTKMLQKSGKLCTDRTHIKISDHFLFWLALVCLSKCCAKKLFHQEMALKYI